MKAWLRLLAILALVLSVQIAHADPQDPTRDKPLPDPKQEAQARAFMREIRCVVCQSQSIDESDAEIAAQLRNAIREQMAAGKSEDEIRDYLVARYGDFVLLKPPFNPGTLLLWVGPFVLVAIGSAVVFVSSRKAAGPAYETSLDLSSCESARLNRLLAREHGQNPREHPRQES